jgi:predicted ribonuclease toxin of YeeF-YezG toxin-antitoxin module
MELKKSKTLVNDILDICSQLEEETLSEACAGIYNDIQAAKNVESVIASAREIMVFVNEAPWDGMEYLKDEIEEIFAALMEEYDEF